ncbi:MAG: sensor histidine kinase [Solirubrobacteraceae bacterium]
MHSLLGEAGWALAAVAIAGVFRARSQAGARREAIARISHELRGPLTAVRLGLGAEGSAEPKIPAARLRAVELELERAALAIDDLAGLAVAGREAPVPRRELVELGPLLEDAVRAWRPVASRCGRTLELAWEGPPPSVLGARARLAQATGNLLANALEHGGEHVAVIGRLAGETVTIEVSDDGPGLPAPLAAIARRPRGGRGSRGRGLAIVAQIAGAHGGRLREAPGQRGTRLVLELPMARAGTGAGASGAAAGGAAAGGAAASGAGASGAAASGAGASGAGHRLRALGPRRLRAFGPRRLPGR